MDVLELVVVDKVSEVILTNDEYNIGQLSENAYQVLLPKNVEVGDKILHIRPGVVVNNPNIKIPEEYYSKELKAYLAATKVFKNRTVSGIALSLDTLSYNVDFKNALEVGSPVFTGASILEVIEPQDYYNRYGLAWIENYLLFDRYLTVDYKPSRFKFLNIYKIEDKDVKPSDDVNIYLLPTMKNSLNELPKTDENGNEISYRLFIYERLLDMSFGYIYFVKNGVTMVMVNHRVMTFNISRIEQVIKKYKKQINKAKKKKDGEYLDDILLYVLEKAVTIINKVVTGLNENDGDLVCIGGGLIGKKILDNYYDLEEDYKLVIDSLLVFSTDNNDDKSNQTEINSNYARNVDLVLKDTEDYVVKKPLKIITNYEQIKKIFVKMNEGDMKYFETEFIHKYIEDSGARRYPWLSRNPVDLVLANYSFSGTGTGKEHSDIFYIENNQYLKYITKE